MTDKLKVVAAIREALEAINAPIGNMVDRQEAVIRTLNARFAWQAACNPEAITTVLDALNAALERVKVLEAQREEANEALARIGDFAHDKSSGPAVPDALWEIRSMAYDAVRFFDLDAAMEVNNG